MKKTCTMLLTAIALLTGMRLEAQVRATITDVLNRDLTGVTGTSYTEWSGKTSNSTAVYAGQSAGGYESIQLRSTNSNSGIITTASGGTATKITVTWNAATAEGRKLKVFGSSTAYTSPTELYDSSTQGELLGEIVKGTSTELTISGTYPFIGMRSASGAMYLTEIDIDWETGGSLPTVATPTFTPAAGYYAEAQTVTIGCETPDASIYYTINGDNPTSESTPYNGPITVSTTTTVKAIAYVGTDVSNIATATYTILTPYTTIPALFEAATNTATPVGVTFNNWVISAVAGSNAYLTDGTNGLIIYESGHGFTTGDILSGTAVCQLQLYNGNGELKELASTTEGLTVTAGGTLTPVSSNIADLSGVNAGSLITISNVTYDGAAFTDGTNTITPYTTLYAGTYQTGHNYNITGIFLMYNETKEILPRSAEDIEDLGSGTPLILPEITAVNAPAAETSGTIPVSYYNIDFTNAPEVQLFAADGATPATYDWLTVTIGADHNVSYSIAANTGEARTAYFKIYALDTEANGVYSELVSISQAAYVAPGDWVLTTLADLTPADVFVIVGTHTADGTSFAMSNDKGTSNPPTAVAVTLAENTVAGAVAENLQWTISGNATDGYTFYPVREAARWLYCTNSNNGVKVGVGDAKHFTLSAEGYLTTTETTAQRYLGVYNQQDWRSYTSINDNIADQTFAFYKKDVALSTHTLDIAGYGTSAGGYHLIASPVTWVRPTAENGFLTSAYDLYYFDQTAELEWQNYEANAFNLESGKGYLYASSANTTLTFTGEAYTGDGVVSLAYDPEASFAGWNLIGNPFGTTAYLADNRPYYVMNAEGTELQAASGNEIGAMQGIFVIAADAADNAVTFTTTAPGKSPSLVLNLMGHRGGVADRAIVRFDQSAMLPKIQLNPESTKLYFAQDDEDYAVVRSSSEAEMPLDFKANEDGTYTLRVATENLALEYLHLIDNLTGADIDLLASPNYSFDAQTGDYTSRFRLVFKTTTDFEELVTEPFAFFNGNAWLVNNGGTATLQLIDITGRIVSSETVSGNATIATDKLGQGVYVMRLINGDGVKTQKIVVR